MSQKQLTGTRIRERRMDRGMRQSDLARQAGISASYLNLIEHNRRRIGGKLLQDIAQALGVERTTLTDGAEAGVLEALGQAAARVSDRGVELTRSEEFAGRFPGWAGLIAAQNRRIGQLEEQIKVLADRLAHDPQLAEALHEVISAVTSIRSTASILVEDDTLDQDWLNRFHGNIHKDSQRLAESSQSLVAYLDTAEDEGGTALLPQEEVESFLARRGYWLPDLDQAALAGDSTAVISDVLGAADTPPSRVSQRILRAHLREYSADARALPFEPFFQAVNDVGPNPDTLADMFDVPMDQILRRLAHLPDQPGKPQRGLAICDMSGALIYQKPLGGFQLPRASGSCPLWPIYQSLARPGFPIRGHVALPGEPSERFLCYAVARPRVTAGFDREPVMEATMLVLPASDLPQSEARPVGIGCRVCPRTDCVARREPSILSELGEKPIENAES
ncbi:short-chain fatty acyl-CoA regulator family protein [Aestuariibius sp. HNIBRBA575]|uniref:short-chain fatty acyl-CoA regulator family protein n=1 Tax=Aestuariibius sp. HNIBRBA575 TaxID=3233343 RepID=UPI0034A502C4